MRPQTSPGGNLERGPYYGNDVPDKYQYPPTPGALRCEKCGWYSGQQHKTVTEQPCGHVICNSCCCPERGDGHVCRCSEDDGDISTPDVAALIEARANKFLQDNFTNPTEADRLIVLQAMMIGASVALETEMDKGSRG